MKACRVVTFALLFLLIASTASILSSCGGSSSVSSGDSGNSGSGAAGFAGTQPPGDFWSWTVATDASGSGTFTAANNTKTLNYSGSISGLAGNSAGISKLSVTSTTDPTLTPPASAYAIEVPNTVLLAATAPFVKGVTGVQNSLRPPVFAVAQGSCPSTGANLIWIAMPLASWCPTVGANNPLGNGCASAGNAYGTAALSVSGASYAMNVTSFKLDGTQGSAPFTLSGGTCSQGVIQFSDSNNKPVRIAFTPSGVFFVDTQSDALAGIVQPDSPINLADFLQSGRSFKGVWYTSLDNVGLFNTQAACLASGGTWLNGECGNYATQPISASADGTQLSGHPFSDIDNGTFSTEGGSIHFSGTSQQVPGLIKGTFASACGGPTSDIVMAARQVNNKYIGLLLTHSPCTTFDVGFNVLAIQQ